MLMNEKIIENYLENVYQMKEMETLNENFLELLDLQRVIF